MKLSFNMLTRFVLPLAAVVAVATSTAHADQPVMHHARDLAQQAHDILQNGATADKGGHKANAIKLLEKAIEQINAGIEFDRVNDSGAKEGKKGKKK